MVSDKALDRLTFEEAMERLEAVVRTIESGEAPLEESIAAYEQGAKLLRRCAAILERAEQRVREMSLEQLEQAGERTDEQA